MNHEVRCGIYRGKMCDCTTDVVLNEMDQVFHRLAIKERDYERSVNAELRTEIERLQRKLEISENRRQATADYLEEMESARDTANKMNAQLSEGNREMARMLNLAREREAEYRAARMSYASLFPPNADGEPDVGSIHENIRNLIAENNLLQAAQGMLKAERGVLKADVENLQSENARLRIGYDPLASKDHGEAQAAVDKHRTDYWGGPTNAARGE